MTSEISNDRMAKWLGRKLAGLSTLHTMEERPMQTCHVHVWDCGPEGYYAEVPAMPGCRTEGDTEAEVRSHIAEAIALYREVTPGDIRLFDSRHCHREGGQCIEVEA